MKLIFIYFLASFFILASCEAPGDKAISNIEGFYNEFYKHGADKYKGSLKKSREMLDYSNLTPQMAELVKNNFVQIPEEGTYKLTAEVKSDTSIIVTSIGKSNGRFGNMVEVRNQYLVTNINGRWKISDTYGLIGFYLNFQIDDTQWQFYWDSKKSKILNEVMKSVKLDIINPGEKAYSSSIEGKIRITNNSNYDIKNLEVLIEHFDSQNISVNTDNEYINEVIRSKGYREYKWYTSDCSQCAEQKFRIKFILETIK